MDCAIVIMVLLSLHTGCHGLALADPKADPKADPLADPLADPHYPTPRPPPGIYQTPSPEPPKFTYLPPTWGTTPKPREDICEFEVIQSLETIPVTETKLLPPVTEIRILPVVTSYMDMPPITDTMTVIDTTTLPPRMIYVPLPPVTRTTLPIYTIVSTIPFTNTETIGHITETETREVTKHVPGMPITLTVVLTSTVTQGTMLKTIYLDDVTTTITYPPHLNFATPTLVSTVILPPHTTTVISKWVEAHTPQPVTSTHHTVTINLPPVTHFTTLTIKSEIVIPPSTTIITVPTTSTICKPTYSYPAPEKPFTYPRVVTTSYVIPPINERDFSLPSPSATTTLPSPSTTTTTRDFHHGPTAHSTVIHEDPVTDPVYDYYDYGYEHNTEVSF